MTAKHTPGPWNVTTEVDKEGYGRHTVRAASNGGPLAYLENYNGHEREANARLIAAAPDLLEALQEALMLLKALPAHDQLIDKAVAAIAKATGDAA